MRATALFVASLAAACGNAATGNLLQPPATMDSALPRGAAILDGATVPTMLSQCSRNAPTAGEGTWQPAAADILALEAGLAAALTAQHRARSPDWSHAPHGWLRQYVGIVRGGRRFIYGNFFPDDMPGMEAERWQHEPVRMCDGGPVFFGVEYDVETRRFTHFAFDGALTL
jgi:hypothetical protein